MSQCPQCPKTFLCRSGLHKHIRFYHENRKDHYCKFCDKWFTTRTHLKVHMEAKHLPRNELKYSCDKCEYKTHSKKYLFAHKTRHKGSSRRECYFCGRQFLDFTGLVRHLGKIHNLER